MSTYMEDRGRRANKSKAGKQQLMPLSPGDIVWEWPIGRLIRFARLGAYLFLVAMTARAFMVGIGFGLFIALNCAMAAFAVYKFAPKPPARVSKLTRHERVGFMTKLNPAQGLKTHKVLDRYEHELADVFGKFRKDFKD